MKKPKGIKPHYFIINSGPYKNDIFVCVNYNVKQVEKMFTKYKCPPLSLEAIEHIEEKKEGSALYLYHSDKQHRTILLWPRNNNEMITSFDHEKVHLLYDVMNTVGMPLCSETEEAFAYLSEFLMQQFLEKVKWL